MVVVAAKGGPEAHHAMHFPLTVGSLAVQRTPRVSLGKMRALLEKPRSLRRSPLECQG